MGGFINQLTSPIGVKLFSGPPYADAGAGDKMQGNLQQYMQQIAPIIASIAQQAGVVNPLTGQTTGVPMAGGTTPGDPYGLSALDQAAVNKQAGIDSQTYQKILSTMKANLSARGMGDSSTMAAAEQYLQSQLSTQIGGEQLQAGQNAFQNRQNALGQIAQLLSGQYGAQQGVAQQQGQLAMQKQQQSMTQLGSLLGLAAGGTNMFGMWPKSTPPIAGGMSNPAAGQNTSGAGIPPGQGIASLLGNFNWGSIYGGG